MLDIIINPPRVLCREYRAVLAQARSLGYTLPTPAQQRLQNRLLLELQWNGIWSKLDIFYSLVNNGSKEFATIDWVTPSTHQITLVNTPTWAASTGFTSDGATSYLDTNYNPSTMGIQYTLDNASRFAWLQTDGGTVIDGIGGTGSNTMTASNSTAQKVNQTGANASSFVDLSGTGLRAVNRTSSTNLEIFAGTTQSSRTATSTSLFNGNQLMFRSNASYAAHTISIYGMGASLVNENTALNNILSTYMACI